MSRPSPAPLHSDPWLVLSAHLWIMDELFLYPPVFCPATKAVKLPQDNDNQLKTASINKVNAGHNFLGNYDKEIRKWQTIWKSQNMFIQQTRLVGKIN